MCGQEFLKIGSGIDQLASTDFVPSPAEADELKARFSNLCIDVTLQFREKFLSGAAEPLLRRYFCYHLQLIEDLGWRLDACHFTSPLPGDSVGLQIVLQQSYGSSLAGLTDHIRNYFAIDPPHKQTAFPAYTRHFMKRLSRRTEEVSRALQSARIQSGIKNELDSFLRHMQQAGKGYQLEYGTLFYFEHLLNTLSHALTLPGDDPGEILATELIRCNFNHLGILTCLQLQMTHELKDLSCDDQKAYIKAKLKTLCSIPGNLTPAFDPNWPSLEVMLSGWLKEKMAGLAENKEVMPSKKLFLKTSVAHLACFLRAFQGEYFNDVPVGEIFKWVSQHCRTKRQGNISAGSLAKEYYSVNQFTAARVRDQLLKMAAAITSLYFPAVAAISAAFFFR